MKALYSNRKKFRCSMYTIIFKTAALREKFPGGVRKFGKTHYICYNRDIAVYCDMGSGIDDIFKRMIKFGLTYFEDFFIFDASGHLGDPRFKEPQRVEFPVDWIRGHVRGPATMVSFDDGQGEEKHLIPDTGDNQLKLRARELF